MSDPAFYDLGIFCTHCGQPLSARALPGSGIQIQGLRSLEYRHTISKSKQCTTVYDAQPYDGWSATKAYEKSRAGEVI